MGKTITNLTYYLPFVVCIGTFGFKWWHYSYHSDRTEKDSIKFNSLLNKNKFKYTNFNTDVYQNIANSLYLANSLNNSDRTDSDLTEKIWDLAELTPTTKIILNIVYLLNHGVERDTGYLSRNKSPWNWIKIYAQQCSTKAQLDVEQIKYPYSRALLIGTLDKPVNDKKSNQNICTHIIQNKKCSYK